MVVGTVVISGRCTETWLGWFKASGQPWFGFLILMRAADRLIAYGQEVLRHESIHILQQRELLIVGWYLIYGGHFVYNYIKLSFNKSLYLEKNQTDSWWLRFWAAYLLVCFEVEAYKYEGDTDYIKSRKLFAWLRG